jgi:uncharacterized membrane protein
MVTAWKPILAALVIFGAGAVTGGYYVKQTAPAPAARSKPDDSPWGPRAPHQDFINKLALTAGQRAEIELILEDSQRRTHELWETIAPQAREEFRRTRDLIRQQLTPEQLEIFEQEFKPRHRQKKEDATAKEPKTTALDFPCGLRHDFVFWSFWMLKNGEPKASSAVSCSSPAAIH